MTSQELCFLLPGETTDILCRKVLFSGRKKGDFRQEKSVQCKDAISADGNSPRLLRGVLNGETLRYFTLVNRARVKHSLIPRPETWHYPPSRQWQGVAWGCLWF